MVFTILPPKSDARSARLDAAERAAEPSSTASVEDSTVRFERTSAKAEKAPLHGERVPLGAFRVGGVADFSAATAGGRRLGGVPIAIERNAPLAEPSRHSPALRAQTLASIVPPDRSGLPADWNKRSNFSEWHFMATSGEKFSDVTARLDAAKARGVGTIMIYPPYHGDPKAWLGALPIDIQSTSPAAGTTQDFEKLVKEAHQRGMAVTMYLGPQNIHRDSTLFKQAVQDKAAGRDTAAARSFIWSDAKKKPADLGVNQSGWEYSKEAKSWFATSWTHPAINMKSQEGVDHVANAVEFWAKKGVDGFYVDAPDTHIGTSKADEKYLFGDLPRAYGTKYAFPEGQGPEALEKRFAKSGFNFGIFGPDLDSWGPVEAIFDGEATANDLEENFRKFRDLPVSQGGGAERPLVLHNEEKNPSIALKKDLLSAAAYSGNGVHLDVFHRIEPGAENNFADLPPERKQPLSHLMSVIGERPAQAVGAGRKRLSTGSDGLHFAAHRTSVDGRTHALNIYNFKDKESWVTVDLAGSGIKIGQTPRDAFSGLEAAPISAQQYRVKLPPYGFLLLDVEGANRG